MIRPTDKDISRKVIYTSIGGEMTEEGVLRSFNSHYVFVSYRGGLTSMATRPEDLTWAHPLPGDDVT